MTQNLITPMLLFLFKFGNTNEPTDLCHPQAVVGRPYRLECSGDTRSANVHWNLTRTKGKSEVISPCPDVIPCRPSVYANITELSDHSVTNLIFDNVTEEDAGTVVKCVFTENRKPAHHVRMTCRLGLCSDRGSVQCSVNMTYGEDLIYTCAIESTSRRPSCSLRLEEKSMKMTSFITDAEFKQENGTLQDGGKFVYCQVVIANLTSGNYSFIGVLDTGCGEHENAIHGIIIQASKPTVSLTMESQPMNFCRPLLLHCDAHDFGALPIFHWLLDKINVTEKSRTNCKAASNCTSKLKLTSHDYGKAVTCRATANQTSVSSEITTPSQPKKPPEFKNTAYPLNVVYIAIGENFNLTCQHLEQSHTLHKLILTCWKNGTKIGNSQAVLNGTHLPLTGSQDLENAICNCSAAYEAARCLVLVSSVSIFVNGSTHVTNAVSHLTDAHAMPLVYITISAIAVILLVFILGFILMFCSRIRKNSRPSNPIIPHSSQHGIYENLMHIYEQVDFNPCTQHDRPVLQSVEDSSSEETHSMEEELLMRPSPGRRVFLSNMGYMSPHQKLPDVVNQHSYLIICSDSDSLSPETSREKYQETRFISANFEQSSGDGPSSLFVASIQSGDSLGTVKTEYVSPGSKPPCYDKDNRIRPLSLFALSDVSSNHEQLHFKGYDESFFVSDQRQNYCFMCEEIHTLPLLVDNVGLTHDSVESSRGWKSRHASDDTVVMIGQEGGGDGGGNSDCSSAGDYLSTNGIQRTCNLPDKQHQHRRGVSRSQSLGRYRIERVVDHTVKSDMQTRVHLNWHPSKIKKAVSWN